MKYDLIVSIPLLLACGLACHNENKPIVRQTSGHMKPPQPVSENEPQDVSDSEKDWAIAIAKAEVKKKGGSQNR